ncbi:vomeronasal type-2 receptor 26-like [Protopterus annectens]|uniref:vomeronasal type-2 receptor 26-like n=1 Tax=Protopterus annectens TaxID=7888 RepID=UPI001CFA10FE|nr:vomeronasal type-2 receptor 26-like [Protopterus annectens]
MNISDEQRQWLNNLRFLSVRFLKPDKGGGLVVFDDSQYKEKMLEILTSQAYEDSSLNEINVTQGRIRGYFRDLFLAGKIDLDTYNYIDIITPKLPVMFGIPKIHKDQKNPPMRALIDDSNNCFTCTAAYWPNEQQDACIQKSTDFLTFDEPLGKTLAALCTFTAFIPAAILLIFIKNKNTPIVKANNRELSYLLLFVLILCFLCSLLFIGQPTAITCLLRQVVFGISFALCVSCVLAKTMMVIIAFRATNPNSNLRQWVGPKLPNAVVFTCTLFQVVICSAWLASSPPFPEHNMTSQNGIIILECNEGSNVAFWFMLSYMGLLAVASFAMAFLTRNLPDSFNEAKFITFSMLVFLSVWLSFIPAYSSTKGKFLVAVEIFAIVTSSAGLLTCIFIPKCIIILLRPENNSKDYLMKRANK